MLINLLKKHWLEIILIIIFIPNIIIAQENSISNVKDTSITIQRQLDNDILSLIQAVTSKTHEQVSNVATTYLKPDSTKIAEYNKAISDLTTKANEIIPKLPKAKINVEEYESHIQALKDIKEMIEHNSTLIWVHQHAQELEDFLIKSNDEKSRLKIFNMLLDTHRIRYEIRRLYWTGHKKEIIHASQNLTDPILIKLMLNALEDSSQDIQRLGLRFLSYFESFPKDLKLQVASVLIKYIKKYLPSDKEIDCSNDQKSSNTALSNITDEIIKNSLVGNIALAFEVLGKTDDKSEQTLSFAKQILFSKHSDLVKAGALLTLGDLLGANAYKVYQDYLEQTKYISPELSEMFSSSILNINVRTKVPIPKLLKKKFKID